jgi:hypothetical protein
MVSHGSRPIPGTDRRRGMLDARFRRRQAGADRGAAGPDEQRDDAATDAPAPAVLPAAEPGAAPPTGLR